MKNNSFLKKFIKDEGAVIVEATIVLPIFIFLVITLMSVVNICMAQAKIQIAVNSAAKEMSTYAYLYGLTGLNDKRAAMARDGQTATGVLDEGIDGVIGIYDSIQDMSDNVAGTASGDISVEDLYKEAKNSASSIERGADSVKNTYETIKNDPKGFLLGMGKATATVGIDKASSYLIAAPLAKLFCEKHLKTVRLSANDYLTKLGVEGGFDGIDFTSSSICKSGKDEICVVAKYQIHVMKFFNIDVKYNFIQSGTTRAWFGQQNAKDE